LPHLDGFIHLYLSPYIKQLVGIYHKAREKPRLQPTPVMQQEIFFFERESVIQIIWSGLIDLRGAGWCA
ncbi:hypothetical protein IWW34DRAFT_888122, partial [Fusarium oxysporum f. sp. albedinis]